MKKIVALLTMMILVLTLLIGCGSNQKQEERTFRIATQYTGFGYYANALMKEFGLLEKHLPDGVTVEWHDIVSANEMRDALISGQVDLTGFSTPSITTAIQNGMPIVFVSHIGANTVRLYSNKKDITSYDTLKPDHRISVPTLGTTVHSAFLIGAINDLGSADKFENSITILPNADAVTALISGMDGIDVIGSPFPTLLALEEAENVHMIRDLSNEIVEYGIGTVMGTTKEFAEQNPDLLDAYLSALDDVCIMLAEDQESCLDLLMDTYGCDTEVGREMLDFFLASMEYDGEKYDKLMGFLYERGFLEKPAPTFVELPKYVRSGS